MVERVLSKFASTEAKILAEHLHRTPEENDYFGVASETFKYGYFTPIDYIYLRLAMHENATAATKTNILCNVLEVNKVQPEQVKRARRKS
jgi:hypothetical protein